MSDEGIDKIKDFIKVKTEVIAEKTGQKLGELAFEVRKAYEAASPLAKSALSDVGLAAKAASASFNQAMKEAEARAKARADNAGSVKASRDKGADISGGASGSGSGSGSAPRA